MSVPAAITLSAGARRDQLGLLALRSCLRIWRQPAQFVFPLVFPILLLIINSAGLQAADQLPGFPAESYLQFWLANPFVFGAITLATISGANLATDIETGFLDRMLLTPTSSLRLLFGHLGGVVVVAAVNGCCYLIVGVLLGAPIESGLLGVPVILVYGMLLGLAFGGFGAYLALRLGTTEAVEGMFPVFFVFLFLSSSNLPRNLMTVDWFRIVATLNPLSYAIEGIRSLITTGWDATALARGFGVVLAMDVVAMALAAGAARSAAKR